MPVYVLFPQVLVSFVYFPAPGQSPKEIKRDDIIYQIAHTVEKKKGMLSPYNWSYSTYMYVVEGQDHRGNNEKLRWVFWKLFPLFLKYQTKTFAINKISSRIRLFVLQHMNTPS